MFNFKSPLAGKVFKKLNHMDKKQAYTYGGIAIVVLVALLTLAAAKICRAAVTIWPKCLLLTMRRNSFY